MTTKDFIEKYEINPTVKNANAIKELALNDDLNYKSYLTKVITDEQITTECFVGKERLRDNRKANTDKSNLLVKLYTDYAIETITERMEDKHGTIEPHVVSYAKDGLEIMFDFIQSLRVRKVYSTRVRVKDLGLMMDHIEDLEE